MLKLRLLGTGSASFDDHPLSGFPRQLPWLLLCYLVLNRGRQYDREHLAAVFWGDHDTLCSRKRLRDTVWRLRVGLQMAGASPEQYLGIEEEKIGFMPTTAYWLDLEIFKTAIGRVQNLSGEQLTPEQAASLETAIQLYEGELLEGVYEDWCLSDREHLHLLHLKSLAKLMRFCAANRSYEKSLLFGEQILGIDNTQESIHREMMRVYLLEGDRSAALAQYKRCEQILRDELGVTPVSETVRLYQQILHDNVEVRKPEQKPSILPSKQTGEASGWTMLDQARQRLHDLVEVLEQSSNELQEVEHLLGLSVRRKAQQDADKPEARPV
jgi:DNA-binding SARP family transcriptional activator